MKRLLLSLLIAACSIAIFGEDDGGLIIAPRAEKAPAKNDLNILAAKLKSADFNVVQAAAAELASTKDARVLPYLVTLYNEGDAQRRLLAVRSIGSVGKVAQSESFFQIALADPYQAIRLSACDELMKAVGADNATARFIESAGDEKKMPPLYRYRSLQAVTRCGGKGAAECLATYLKGANSELAIAAAEGLGLLGDLKQAETLIKMLDTQDLELKPAVADALERLTGEKNRFDLVKWNEWLKNFKEASRDKSPSEAPVASEYGPDLKPRDGQLDVVIVFDTTGSMLNIWPQVSTAIDGVLSEMMKQQNSLRIGTVKYRASDPNMSLSYTIKPKPLSRKLDEIRNDIMDATFGGGSGGLQLGLNYAVKSMPWRREARKIVILVGDTSPSEGVAGSQQTIREAWQMDGVIVHTLYVRTAHGSEHVESYRALAQAGVGRFYEYNKAEKHLVDMSTEKVDLRTPEPPEKVAQKLTTPRK